jgi:hypothetical protein
MWEGAALVSKGRSEEAFLVELARVEPDFEAFNALVFGKTYPDLPAVSPAQEDYFYNSLDVAQNVLCCGNSWGKTDYLARKHTYMCIYKHGLNLPPAKKAVAEYNTLNCSYTYDISKKVFNRIVGLKRTSEIMRWMILKVDNTKFEIEFRCGSKFTAGTTKDRGKYIEGERIFYLSCEEAGYETDLCYLRDNVFKPRTLVPSATVTPSIDYVGTPKHFSDPEYEVMFNEGQDPDNPRCYSREGSTYENIYLTPDQIRELEEGLDDESRARVIYGKFASARGAPFSSDLILPIFSEHLTEEERRANSTYVTTWDLARINDKTVGYVLDVTYKPFKRIVKRREMRGNDWEDIFDMIEGVHYEYGAKMNCIDSTGMGGDMAHSALSKRRIPLYGLNFAKKKESIMENLRIELGREIAVPARWSSLYGDKTKGTIKSFPCKPLKEQLTRWRWKDESLATDDLMALAIGNYYLSRGGSLEKLSGVDMVGRLINR